MKTHLRRSLRRGRGATTTETVMLLVLIAMVVIASVKMLGGGIGQNVDFATDSVGAVSTDDNEMERLRANQRKAEARKAARGGGSAASASASTGGSAGSSGGGDSGESGAERRAGAASAQSAPAVAPRGGCGGDFNPFLIPIALGMLGLLGYVVAKSQKG